MDGVFKAVIICSFIIGTVVAIILIWLALAGKVRYEMLTYTAQNENTALDIEIQAGCLRTEYYDGDKVSVEYPVAKGYTAKVCERDGVFRFENNFRAFFLFVPPKIPDIVIKLPHGFTFDMGLKMSAGSANLAGGQFGRAELKMSAGSFKCEGLDCSSLKLNISGGATTVGTVNCNLLDLHMSTGSATINKVICKNTRINVSAGSARLGFTGLREEYGISKSVSAGSCNVSAQRGTTDKTIDINASAGSVKCEFGI